MCKIKLLSDVKKYIKMDVCSQTDANFDTDIADNAKQWNRTHTMKQLPGVYIFYDILNAYKLQEHACEKCFFFNV